MDGGSVLGLGIRAEGGMMNDREVAETSGMSKTARMVVTCLRNILLLHDILILSMRTSSLASSGELCIVVLHL